MALEWYAIQTYSGSEKSVKLAIENLLRQTKLLDKMEQIVVPTEDIVEFKNNKRKIYG